MGASTISAPRCPWNKDKLVGQKRPFKLKEIWAIRTRLQLSCRTRDLALFNLGIASFGPATWSSYGCATWPMATGRQPART